MIKVIGRYINKMFIKYL